MASWVKGKDEFKGYIQAICVEALSRLRQVCQAQVQSQDDDERG